MARSVDAAPFDAPEGGVARVAYVSEIPAAAAQAAAVGEGEVEADVMPPRP